MKFIVSSTLLLKNVQSISGVLSTNNTMPILDDFLFDVKENELEITASDLETTMQVSVGMTQSDGTGTIAIPAKILLDTLKTFADIPITFDINLEDSAIELSTDEGKFKLTGHKADEYPQLPIIEEPQEFEITADAMATAINKTIFATGVDELRPVMSGVLCELNEDDITFVATDAHKLVRYRRTDYKPGLSQNFIIPKKPLNQMKSILSAGDDEKVQVQYNETNAFFHFNNVNVICRLIEGKYPNYEAVIPKDNTNTLTVDRQNLLNSIKRVSIFANQSTHQVRFGISGQELVLSAEDVDFSNEAKERLNCNYDGEDMEIGFNSRFIIEMLNNLTNDEVIFELSTPERAGLISPAEKDENEDILMLVMPVMLNS
ncbi:MAG: DNA polymerase III subunit beta [Bacteroidales bacterium]|nr:DNA polymerase III subunit beta [Bacteroidales bacterium]